MSVMEVQTFKLDNFFYLKKKLLIIIIILLLLFLQAKFILSVVIPISMAALALLFNKSYLLFTAIRIGYYSLLPVIYHVDGSFVKEVRLHMVEFLCVYFNLARTRAFVIVLMR